MAREKKKAEAKKKKRKITKRVADEATGGDFKGTSGVPSGFKRQRRKKASQDEKRHGWNRESTHDATNGMGTAMSVSTRTQQLRARNQLTLLRRSHADQ